MKDRTALPWSWFAWRTAVLAVIFGLIAAFPFSGIQSNDFRVEYLLLMTAMG